MKKLALCLLPLVAHAADPAILSDLFDAKLNATQRAGACFQMRGDRDVETVAALTRALDDPALLSCAATNLRLAGAVAPLRDALANSNEQVRATAARELGSFHDPDLLDVLSRAAGDENLLVATNAVTALSEYTEPSVIPYLAALAKKGGMTGDLAIDRLAALDSPAALRIARELLSSSQVPDQLYAMRIIGAFGAGSDLPALKKIASSGQENLAQRSRGFGFLPPISLSRAAETAIRSIEGRK